MEMSNCKALEDGRIPIGIRGEDGEIVTHACDVMELNCILAEEEAKANLSKTEDGRYVPTQAFLRALMARMESLGLVGITPTMAFQLWCRVPEELEKLKNSIAGTP